MDNQYLAEILARRLFEDGKESYSAVHRIEFKGYFNGKECGMGGYAEAPLARRIKIFLDEAMDAQPSQQKLAGEQCEHNWIDMRNEVIESGEMCSKCLQVRAGNSEKLGGSES